jgi:hypothetical protein
MLTQMDGTFRSFLLALASLKPSALLESDTGPQASYLPCASVGADAARKAARKS